jgi:hypothetical protein
MSVQFRQNKQSVEFHCKYTKREMHTKEAAHTGDQHQLPSMSLITPNININAANGIINLPSMINSTFDRRWKSSFGAPPEVCCILWNKINSYKTMPAGVD